jgi:hypothetical protein
VVRTGNAELLVEQPIELEVVVLPGVDGDDRPPAAKRFE